MKFYRKHGTFLIPTGLKKKSRDLYIYLLENNAMVVKHKTITGRVVARVLTHDGSPVENVSLIHFLRLKNRHLVIRVGHGFVAVSFTISSQIVEHKRLKSGAVKPNIRKKKNRDEKS